MFIDTDDTVPKMPVVTDPLPSVFLGAGQVTITTQLIIITELKRAELEGAKIPAFLPCLHQEESVEAARSPM